MGYVFDFNDAKAYEEWFIKPRNIFAADLERRLMIDMLKPVKAETVLDIGCGTGASLLPLLEMGLQATGIEPSPYMLDIAKNKFGDRVDFHRGLAEDLPFEDNSFNYACLVTTLEFVDDHCKALEEACRVAKDKIFLGVLNRYAIKGIQRRVKGVFIKSIYNHANFFSIWELKKNVRSLLGDPPITWRTVCQLPSASSRIAQYIEQSNLVQRFPFGAFAGMVVTLVPRFRTRPLSIPVQAKPSTDAMAG
jgi:SAM-dependent methyltransferase